MEASLVVHAQYENYRLGSGRELKTTVSSVPPGLTEAVVILRPNPKQVERNPKVAQIWGEPIVISNVRVRRYDQ